ncbi:hypothetical protein HDA32_001577 [Spinactinospora alkalitolerans]|uniref:DUF5709 domain-containing protein n=1 Tax=Spinactinospora alkalitolerans TaxID=687207 RepID=A0A852TT38_9ACTN|nr:DUF5709 domain-containing protein [Spinactinospora alkalitolerans]NYE46457.1 hypothetical protein [Spinactinospora alkalitolerans]
MSENRPENRVDPINDQASDWEEVGLPAQEDSTEDSPLPQEEPVAMDEFGTTGTEREAGEPLDTALSREQPDVEEQSPDPVDAAETDPRSERLVSEDEGVREDHEGTLIAEDTGFDRGVYSAEEQAVREEDESELP